MPRLRQVPRSEAKGSVLAFYNLLFGDRDPVKDPGTETGSPGNWWTTFALVPAIFEHAIEHFKIFGMFAESSSGTLPAVVRELGILRAGYTIGSVFVYSQHSKVARAAGLSERKVADIGHWPASDAYTAEDRVILAYADALLLQRGRVPDDLFAALRKILPDEQILEFSYHTMSYALHATLSRALKLEFDDIGDRLREIPAPSAA
jgi:alkylhydroperoxidase family enzyme